MSAMKRPSSPTPESSEPPRTKTALRSKSSKRVVLGKTTSNTSQPPATIASPTESEDSSSDSDTSSDSESESESERGEIPLIRPLNARPVMRVSALGVSEGLSQLPDFLKKMKEANEELMRKMEGGEERGLEDVREGESYVEMNLGLGVLEEKRDGDSSSSEESEDEEEEDDGDGDQKMKDGCKNAGIEEL